MRGWRAEKWRKSFTLAKYSFLSTESENSAYTDKTRPLYSYPTLPSFSQFLFCLCLPPPALPYFLPYLSASLSSLPKTGYFQCFTCAGKRISLPSLFLSAAHALSLSQPWKRTLTIQSLSLFPFPSQLPMMIFFAYQPKFQFLNPILSTTTPTNFWHSLCWQKGELKRKECFKFETQIIDS